MDPISVIVAALVAGASSAAKETAGAVIKDAYAGFKKLIESRFSRNAAAIGVLEAHETDPETWDKPLRKSLAEVDPENDNDLLETAKSLLKLVDPEGTSSGKYSINVTGNVQGLVQGDHNEVTMNFGNTDESKK